VAVEWRALRRPWSKEINLRIEVNVLNWAVGASANWKAKQRYDTGNWRRKHGDGKMSDFARPPGPAAERAQ